MMTEKDLVVCALDIGSSRVKAVLAKFDEKENRLKILSADSVFPSAAKRGVVSDMSLCTQAVAGAVESVELKGKEKVDYLFLTIPNSQIDFGTAKGVCLLEKEKPITQKEVEQAIKSSAEFYLPLERKTIRIIVKEYIIDGQEGILNPVGMLGKKLEVKTVILYSKAQVVSNLITAVEEAGFTVNELIASPLAQAQLLLTQEERETGAILFDIGEQTINFSYFKDNSIADIKSLKAGIGESIKNISYSLRIPYEYASELSQRYFTLLPFGSDSNEKILVKRENGDYESVLRKDFCLYGIEALREVFGFIEDCLKRYPKALSVVLCGGGVLVDGFSEKLENYDMDIRIGSPIYGNMDFSMVSFKNPLFLNCICACVYGCNLLREKRLARFKGRNFLSRSCFKIKSLIEEYF